MITSAKAVRMFSISTPSFIPSRCRQRHSLSLGTLRIVTLHCLHGRQQGRWSSMNLKWERKETAKRGSKLNLWPSSSTTQHFPFSIPRRISSASNQAQSLFSAHRHVSLSRSAPGTSLSFSSLASWNSRGSMYGRGRKKVRYDPFFITKTLFSLCACSFRPLSPSSPSPALPAVAQQSLRIVLMFAMLVCTRCSREPIPPHRPSVSSENSRSAVSSASSKSSRFPPKSLQQYLTFPAIVKPLASSLPRKSLTLLSCKQYGRTPDPMKSPTSSLSSSLFSCSSCSSSSPRPLEWMSSILLFTAAD
mmetsp:Transcript_25449/g.84172  ORF Transcript_25449/g.84172 Transcript_25449/m.84172 type:complete len:304 (+) Transcript_25449:682-1593(+)